MSYAVPIMRSRWQFLEPHSYIMNMHACHTHKLLSLSLSLSLHNSQLTKLIARQSDHLQSLVGELIVQLVELSVAA
jgi:hypothetical protein